MKYIITNKQYNLIKESEESIIRIPTLSLFDNDWDLLQRYMEKKGNPKYSIEGDLYLLGTPIKSLGNLQFVGGDLNLRGTPIKSLGNLQSVGGNLNLERTPIESLGNLQSVDGNLNLYETPIESLGNLQSVGGYLKLRGTPIKSLGNLQSVGGNLNLERTPIESLGNLQSLVFICICVELQYPKNILDKKFVIWLMLMVIFIYNEIHYN